jgi:hypothetical protein
MKERARKMMIDAVIMPAFAAVLSVLEGAGEETGAGGVWVVVAFVEESELIAKVPSAVVLEAWAVGVDKEAEIVVYGDARIGGMKGDVCAEGEDIDALSVLHV